MLTKNEKVIVNALKKHTNKKDSLEMAKDFLLAFGVVVEKKDTPSMISHAIYQVFQDSYKRTAQKLGRNDIEFLQSPSFQAEAMKNLMIEAENGGFIVENGDNIKNFDFKKTLSSVGNVVKDTVLLPKTINDSYSSKGGTKTLFTKLVKAPVIEPFKATVVMPENAGRALGQRVAPTITKVVPALGAYAQYGEIVENAKVNMLNKASNATLGTSERTDYGSEQSYLDAKDSLSQGKTVNGNIPISDFTDSSDIVDDKVKGILNEAGAGDAQDSMNKKLLLSSAALAVMTALKFII